MSELVSHDRGIAPHRIGAMLRAKIVETAHLQDIAVLHDWLNAGSVSAVCPEYVWR